MVLLSPLINHECDLCMICNKPIRVNKCALASWQIANVIVDCQAIKREHFTAEIVTLHAQAVDLWVWQEECELFMQNLN